MNSRKSIKFLAVLVLIGVLVPYFSAFALFNDITGIGECALRNKLKQFLKDVIGQVVKAIKQLIKGLVCTSLSIITGGLISCPEEVITKGATEVTAAKETIEDIVTRCIARQALSRMTRGMLDIARRQGRDGGVTWVENWRGFQLKAQYRGEGVFRGMLASTNLCNYFGDSLREQFGSSKKVDLKQVKTRTNNFDSFQFRAGCTLPSNFDMNKYKRDFSGNGGWEAWSRLLEPQNNYYGALFQSLDEAERQRALEESTDINQALANRGFLGTSGEGAKDSCLVADGVGRCLAYKNIKTPGVVIGEAAINAAIKSELDWLISTDEINELLVDMFLVTMARLKNLGANDPKTPPIELQDRSIGGEILAIGIGEICDASINMNAEFDKFRADLITAFSMANLPFGRGKKFEEIFFPVVDGGIETFKSFAGDLKNASAATSDSSVKSLFDTAAVISEVHIPFFLNGMKDPRNLNRPDFARLELQLGAELSRLGSILGQLKANPIVCPVNPPGGGAGPCPVNVPDRSDVVASHADLLATSCQSQGGNWDFMDAVVGDLNSSDSRWGYNGKRGNINDPSQDAISYYYGSGSPSNGNKKVCVMDVIGGHCGPNPTPGWLNQGTGGAYLFPR